MRILACPPYFDQDPATKEGLGPWMIPETMVEAQRVYHREIMGQQDARVAFKGIPQRLYLEISVK